MWQSFRRQHYCTHEQMGPSSSDPLGRRHEHTISCVDYEGVIKKENPRILRYTPSSSSNKHPVSRSTLLQAPEPKEISVRRKNKVRIFSRRKRQKHTTAGIR
ncbi:hypothetical protein M3J09_005606 [Ascochyta lentis]